MKQAFTHLMVLLLISFTTQLNALAEEKKAPDLIVEKSRIVVEELLLGRYEDEKLPQDLVRQCAGLAVIPGMFKGAFFIGGSYGKGVVLKHQNGQWTGPAFISIGAGSFGLQFGGQAVDLILVIIGEEAMNSFLRSKFKLGADVAVAAGPIGAQATAATEILLKGGVYSYSRSKGAFIGLSLEGAGIATNEELNQAYYKTAAGPDVILSGKLNPPDTGQRLIQTLKKVK